MHGGATSVVMPSLDIPSFLLSLSFPPHKAPEQPHTLYSLTAAPSFCFSASTTVAWVVFTSASVRVRSGFR